jgi:hypothetical protein
MARQNVMPMDAQSGVGCPSYCQTYTTGTPEGYKTEITIDTTLPAIAGGANLAVGKLILTLPAGAINIGGTHMNVSITQTQGNITADTPDVGVGTTIASGAVAVLGGTAAFENLLTGQTAADCNGTATDKIVVTTHHIDVVDSHSIYLNVADGWAASGDTGALLKGKVTCWWRLA